MLIHTTRATLLLCAILLTSSCSMFKKDERPEGPPAIWVNPSSVAPMARGTHEYPYLNLSVALENAGAGTRILLAPGEYSGPLVISELMEVELHPYFDIYSHERKGYRMEQGEIVLTSADASQPVFTVSGNLALHNVSINGGLNTALVNEGASLKVVDCDITGASGAAVVGINDPIAKGKPGEIRIQKTTLLGNGAGIEIDGNYVEILGCRIVNSTGPAVQARGDYALNMLRCEVESNAAAVDLTLDRKVKITVSGNSILNNTGNGIAIERVGNRKPKRGSVKVSNNKLVRNSGYGFAYSDSTGKSLAPSRLEKTVQLENNYYDSNAAGYFTGIEEF